MKISKHLHSCLLVEEQNKTVLFDPGIYTFEAEVLDISKLARLDYILITHEHPDHFHLPFVRELVTKFPDVKIITNPTIVSLLEKENIKATSENDAFVQLENADHEALWDKVPPRNVAISVFNKLTHVGDSLQFSKIYDILALPLQAPWGSTTEAVNKAIAVKPRTVIPIHDWHWKDEVRQSMYQRLATFFPSQGIQFKALETGEIIEL